MAERQFENVADNRRRVLQGLRGRGAEESAFRPQADPFERLMSRAPGASSAAVHASSLNDVTGSCPSRAGRSLLQLQRRYGNHYIQRILALARQGEDEAEVGAEVESAIERSRGRGQALDTGVRVQMESAFGSDFSGVRVHTGAEVHALSEAVNAIAFTTGSDIFFREGTYSPASSGGRELLAHELAHVVQQGGAPATAGRAQRGLIQRLCPACEEEKNQQIQGKLVVGQPNDQYEQEADHVAKTIVGAPDGKAPATHLSDTKTSGPLQTRCACGGNTTSGGECEDCRRKRLSQPQDGTVGEMPGTVAVDPVASATSFAPLVLRQDDGPGGGDGAPKLPSPLGQAITCSVDPIKIAKALGGDKSAALDIVNCCESGFSPLPAGCSKDLVDALRKLLGKKPGATTRCPPGFHDAKSTTYQGQCCSDGSTIESAQNCCPGERASMMGFCCPEGQVAQGLGCVSSAPSAPTPMPGAPPSEPGDYEVPDESNVAVA